MPVARFEMPDGRIARFEVPEGTTPEQAQQMMAAYAQQSPTFAALQQPKQSDGSVLPDAMRKAMPILSAAVEYPGSVLRSLRDVVAGGVRGAGSIGATIARPFESQQDNAVRRERVDTNMRNLLGADTSSVAYGAGKLGGEIAGTAGIGGAIGRGVSAIPMLRTGAAPLVDAISTAGFSAGGVGGASGAGLRALGGGISGAASAGLVNPADTKTGAAIGAVAPGAVQIAGALGSAVKGAMRGTQSAGVEALAKAVGMSEIDLIRTLQDAAAQSGFVDGSKLTLSQALQKAGKNSPEFAMLERIVSGGPGGDVLLKRYADQAVARLDALKAQGAQVYQGAAAEEATRQGDKIGAILRTQAMDDKAAARAAWESVNRRALDDGVMLQLPINEMEAAMAPLGRGSVVAGRDARNVLDVARDIGAETAVPYEEFQRLRRDSGQLAAKAADRAGNETEAAVLARFQELMTKRADEAASGAAVAGDVMTPTFLSQYNAARGLTKKNAELYKGGNNIASILRKPAGQNYTLTGDEIINKLWHGGGGLAGDVSNLKGVLSANNFDPAMGSLRQYVMTDAASKVTAGGLLGSAMPKYVENRMPGLLEAMTPDQTKALLSVAGDIRNAEAAAAVPGLRGSDTQAKITRAMDAGLLDSPLVKTVSRVLSAKGVGGETIRSKLAEAVIANKGKVVAELLANPEQAAKALKDQSFMQAIDAATAGQIRKAALRAVPVLGTN